MNVREAIEELSKMNPELPVRLGCVIEKRAVPGYATDEDEPTELVVAAQEADLDDVRFEGNHVLLRGV